MLASLPARWLMGKNALPDGFDPAALRAQGVEVSIQRLLLARVVEVGGEATLLSLGEGLLQARDQPLLFVMLNSSTVADFVDKEQRLNRFFHTDHRVRVHELRDALLELEHGGPRERPHRNESLFVLGIHLACLREIGCSGLQCTLPMSHSPSAPLLNENRLTRPASGAAHVWRFSWERFVPKRAPFAGLDDLLLSQHRPSDFATQHDAEESVQRLVETDLAKRWMIGDVARALATSPRTLQRELSARGTSFSAVVERARVAEACRLLRDHTRSITEIGYVCGFADTAHFSRRFKVCTGETPSAFQKRA